MKINSIKYKNITSSQNTYDIVDKNIDIISSARLIMDLEISDDINYNPQYNIYGSINNKWEINNYGATKFLSSIRHKTGDVKLSYFTISSNIVSMNDPDSIEYSGLQLGEIENSYFAKLLCYNSNIAYTTQNQHYSKNLQLFDAIDRQVDIMSDNNLFPKFIVCNSYSLLNSLVDHSTFKPVSSKYQPHTADITINNELIHIIVNNMMDNDWYSNICLCADLIGPMHIKGGVQSWEKENQVVFTEIIGMAVFAENSIKRFVVGK